MTTNHLSSILISDCGFSPHLTKVLTRAGYQTLYDIHKATDRDLLNLTWVGPKSVCELRAVVREALNRIRQTQSNEIHVQFDQLKNHIHAKVDDLIKAEVAKYVQERVETVLSSL